MKGNIYSFGIIGERLTVFIASQLLIIVLLGNLANSFYETVKDTHKNATAVEVTGVNS